MPSNKKRVNPTQTETLAGGNVAKKAKIIPKDPFEGEFSQVFVEIPNEFMGPVLEKLFARFTPEFKFEVTSYRSETSGVSKSVCGVSKFVEETRSFLTLTYETGKKEELVKILNELFPYCSFSDK